MSQENFTIHKRDRIGSQPHVIELLTNLRPRWKTSFLKFFEQPGGEFQTTNQGC